MRRADRLFHLVTLLKATQGRAITAAALAADLGLSVRTVYRDIAHLQANGLPIDGEAGVGYRISPALTLPPVTFTLEQIEAVAAGIRALRSLGDPALAEAGQQALDKIRAVLSPAAAENLLRGSLHMPLSLTADPSGVLAAPLRQAIRERRRTRLTYQRPDQQAVDGSTDRWVRPLELACFGPFWMLAAWCELRGEFRHFRLDRIIGLEVSDICFPEEPGRSLPDYLRWLRATLHSPP